MEVLVGCALGEGTRGPGPQAPAGALRAPEPPAFLFARPLSERSDTPKVPAKKAGVIRFPQSSAMSADAENTRGEATYTKAKERSVASSPKLRVLRKYRRAEPRV